MNSSPKKGAAGPLVLMYHRVGIPGRPSPVNGQYVHPRSFARQMQILRRAGMEVVPLDAVAGHIRGEQALSPRHVAITFDDGFFNLYEHAFPVLVQYGYPSAIFLISQHIGKSNTYHPPERDLYEPLLGAEQILEMQAAGVAFGSHTRHHARLTECSPDLVKEEVRGSRLDLEELLQRPVDWFCYPYGAQDDAVRAEVVAAGYRLACSTLKGRNDAGDDPYRIRRINIRADTTWPVFLYKLARARLLDR